MTDAIGTGRLHGGWLGRLSYDDAHTRQLQICDAVLRGEAPPTLLLLEHDPVITLGRRGDTGDLLASAQELAARGIALRPAERGGQATYHGPGQLVGYLIAPVRSLAPSLPRLVAGIEQALIDLCAHLGVVARRDERQAGVWAGSAKVGFIGLAVTHGVCWHGFALNVDVDLTPFQLIRPCGLDDDVTSIERAGGSPRPLPEVATRAARYLSQVFALSPAFAGGGREAL